LAHKVLGSPDHALVCREQGQNHGLDVLALQVRQLAAHVKPKSIALLLARKQGLKLSLERQQFIGADNNIARRQPVCRLATTGGRPP
jgi:hypothetical protein